MFTAIKNWLAKMTAAAKPETERQCHFAIDGWSFRFMDKDMLLAESIGPDAVLTQQVNMPVLAITNGRRSMLSVAQRLEPWCPVFTRN